ncbi:MAG: cytochrome b561 domain-containing protein [Pseudomonadota bacterium]
MEWLLAPIDPGRVHEVGTVISWHGRIMTLAWVVLAPLAVFTARFLKVLPWQDWPRELDSQVWWRSHWIGQSVVAIMTVGGVFLVVPVAVGGSLHGRLGYAMLMILTVQLLLGAFRGTKGGPTAPAPDGSLRGDHYDMTPWRLMFELAHKALGYTLLFLGTVTAGMGLWLANAPRWMWILVAVWWLGLLSLGLVLQARGWAVDTYQAIWGPSREHPGNRRGPFGWGMRRFEERHVRGD